MTTSSRKFFAVIIERNGQELARDILHIDGAADARRKLMQLVRRHEIDPFAESRNSPNKRGWAESMKEPRPPRSPAPQHETAIGIKTFRHKSGRK